MAKINIISESHKDFDSFLIYSKGMGQRENTHARENSN